MKVVMVAEAGSARLRRGGGWLGGRGRTEELGLAWILDFGFGWVGLCIYLFRIWFVVCCPFFAKSLSKFHFPPLPSRDFRQYLFAEYPSRH